MRSAILIIQDIRAHAYPACLELEPPSVLQCDEESGSSYVYYVCNAVMVHVHYSGPMKTRAGLSGFATRSTYRKGIVGLRVGGGLEHDYQDKVTGRDTAPAPIGDVPETQVCCRQ